MTCRSTTSRRTLDREPTAELTAQPLVVRRARLLLEERLASWGCVIHAPALLSAEGPAGYRTRVAGLAPPDLVEWLRR